jgi:hypothetical protein
MENDNETGPILPLELYIMHPAYSSSVKYRDNWIGERGATFACQSCAIMSRQEIAPRGYDLLQRTWKRVGNCIGELQTGQIPRTVFWNAR